MLKDLLPQTLPKDGAVGTRKERILDLPDIALKAIPRDVLVVSQ